MAIVSNKRDSLFLGTYDAGLFVFKDGKISPLPFPSSPTPDITSLCYSHNSTLWIGTRGRGLWSFANGEFYQYNMFYDNFPSNNINTVYEDSLHRLWIGFSNGGMVFDLDTFITVVPKNVSVFSFLSIGNDSTLIATEGAVNGLQLYHAGVLSEKQWPHRHSVGRLHTKWSGFRRAGEGPSRPTAHPYPSNNGVVRHA